MRWLVEQAHMQPPDTMPADQRALLSACKGAHLFRRGLLRLGANCALQQRGIAAADCQPNHTCGNDVA